MRDMRLLPLVLLTGLTLGCGDGSDECLGGDCLGQTAGSASASASATATTATTNTGTDSVTTSDGTTGGSDGTDGTGDTTTDGTGSSSDSGMTTTGETTGAGSTGDPPDGTWVTLETSMGDIVLQLNPVDSPLTTANFLAYVDAGFYDGEDGLEATIFHRIISGFMIQGGGLTATMQIKSTMAPIVNESSNGLSNQRGTISMARTADPDSATSQFFINHADNAAGLDSQGYAVFGEVTDGMDVVDAIAAVQTTSMSGYDDVPVTPIVILDAYEGVP